MASVFKKMRDRVSSTTKKFTEKIDHLLYYKELDEDFFDELEENCIWYLEYCAGRISRPGHDGV